MGQGNSLTCSFSGKSEAERMHMHVLEGEGGTIFQIHKYGRENGFEVSMFSYNR